MRMLKEKTPIATQSSRRAVPATVVRRSLGKRNKWHGATEYWGDHEQCPAGGIHNRQNPDDGVSKRKRESGYATGVDLPLPGLSGRLHRVHSTV